MLHRLILRLLEIIYDWSGRLLDRLRRDSTSTRAAARSAAGGPPQHWIELVRERAPHLLSHRTSEPKEAQRRSENAFESIRTRGVFDYQVKLDYQRQAKPLPQGVAQVPLVAPSYEAGRFERHAPSRADRPFKDFVSAYRRSSPLPVEFSAVPKEANDLETEAGVGRPEQSYSPDALPQMQSQQGIDDEGSKFIAASLPQCQSPQRREPSRTRYDSQETQQHRFPLKPLLSESAEDSYAGGEASVSWPRLDCVSERQMPETAAQHFYSDSRMSWPKLPERPVAPGFRSRLDRAEHRQKIEAELKGCRWKE